jgi:hypothetical protein
MKNYNYVMRIGPRKIYRPTDGAHFVPKMTCNFLSIFRHTGLQQIKNF